jgi:RNA polymerase sigma factor (sigma-70 family)
MAKIPDTSMTLLKDLASDPKHARWTEFVQGYVPIMQVYMKNHFPDLDADDMIQETLIAIVGALPNYKYQPDKKGAFHNFVIGVLRRKSLDEIDKRATVAKNMDGYGDIIRAERAREAEKPMKVRQEAIFELARQEVMADETIYSRTKQIFERVSRGEDPAVVAEEHGVERNAVDQIKSRMMKKLAEAVERLEKLANGRE